MKHLKHLPWFLAALPIVAIIWFLFPSAPIDNSTVDTQSQASSIENDQKIRNASTGYAPDGSRLKPLTPEEIEARKRFAEAKKLADEAAKRRDEAFKKLASHSTPESRARTVDSIMQRRDRSYKNLFTSWGIDSKTAGEALTIIRERELRIIEDRYTYFQDSGSPKKSKDLVVNNAVENSLADAQLTNLLGEDRASELLAEERRMLEAEYAKAGFTLPKGK